MQETRKKDRLIRIPKVSQMCSITPNITPKTDSQENTAASSASSSAADSFPKQRPSSNTSTPTCFHTSQARKIQQLKFTMNSNIFRTKCTRCLVFPFSPRTHEKYEGGCKTSGLKTRWSDVRDREGVLFQDLTACLRSRSWLSAAKTTQRP